MNLIQTLRRALSDFWDEFFFILVTGAIGAVISLLIIPIPLVLAAHYNSAVQITENRVISVRNWFSLMRLHLGFFVKWFLLLLLVSIVLAGNIYYYHNQGTSNARLLSWVLVGLLLNWLLPQPFVPALYLQQSDRRLRIALRNSYVLMVGNPFTVLALWIVVAILAAPIAYFVWPLLPLLLPVIALLSTHAVVARINREP